MRLIVLASVACALASGAAAQGHTPFEPLASSPDHVVTMIDTDGARKKDRIVTHHGEWTRVDTAMEGRRASQFFKRDEAVTVVIGQGRADDYATISVMLGPERSPLWDYTPVKTDERQTFLGESCTVWNVNRSRESVPPRSPLIRTSCVTDDGIELWYRVATHDHVFSHAEATRVERRAVAAADTDPPQDLLHLDAWFDNAAVPAKTPPDFEAVLEQVGDAPRATRTIRQHGGWTSLAVSEGGALQSLEVSHAFGSFGLHFSGATPHARTQLHVSTLRSPPISRPAFPPREPADMGKRETVLGEQCRWYDLMAGATDISVTACRTQDGITLKEEFGSWGSRSSFEAVRFARRPVGLEEIKPPPDLLDRKRWGLPE